jgi:O-antigen/teichoic acid export membrane protein
VTERLNARGGPGRQAASHSRVGSHTAAYLIARGVPGVMAFLAIPVFTNLLEPGAYASYALTVTALGVANSLFFEWIRLAIVRCFPTKQKLMSSFTSTIVTLWLGISAIVALAVVAALAIPLLRPVGGVLILCVIVLAAQSLFDLVTEFLRADLKPWHFMVLHVIRAGSFVGLGIIFLRAGTGWTGPLIAVAIGMAIATAWAWRGDWRAAGLRLDRGLAGEMFRYGAPISLTVTFAGLIFLSDRALVAVILGSNAAGIYSVAFDFITHTVTLVMIAVSMAVFPIAVRELELRGTDAARRPMMTNAAFLLAVGVPTTVGAGVLAPGISGLFFGPGYSASADIIPLVAVSALLAALKAYHFDAALQLARRTLQQVWIVLGAAVLGVLLNLLLIPVLGLPGAALASVLTFLAAAAFTAWWGRRHFPLPFPVRESLMVFVSSAVMGVALFPFRNEVSALALLTQVVSGALLYFALLTSANFLGARDLARRAVRCVFRKWRSGRRSSMPPTETETAP